MKLLVVSTNAALTMGGEAMKALQYMQQLLADGRDATLITHERCRDALAGELPADRVIYVRDSTLMKACWRTPGLARFVNSFFHLEVARICRGFDPAQVVIHYLCPISPVEQRFPPKGYRYVIGPLSGNIFYPPGFRHLAGRGLRMQQRVYRPLQQALALVSRQFARADRVLVSGYDRTREALGWAGCPEGRMLDVWDAGLSDDLLARPRMRPADNPAHFVWIGRMVPYKGADLAICALSQAPQEARLTLYGDGPQRTELEALARDLGLSGRVTFAGWLAHEDLSQALGQYRALLFPSLKEANGIIVQECMAIGLPVVPLRWGGPLGLATEEEALFVEAGDEAQVVRDLAAAVTQLTQHPDRAEALSKAARIKAETEFPWSQVAQSWYAAALAAHAKAAPDPGSTAEHAAKRRAGG
ncbi:glycosyltransferase family 4 protein [Epibacterium sp. MM17-32]|uniref:glycosyltransferase family 4 protein n=1 Tax=Epibacterium sp. MM17-32 TaxID=2917734 RepID=UPI001EF42411|nr:glycosyltransferase family 4 protein [Epibacterium sp. MM17-32]MCG7630571.1 glycosyltransferase family 4 protein [Epibacterium sp. MM17-32]